LGLEAQTTAKKVRLNPIYDMRGGVGGTVDVFGQFESQIQQRSDFFLSGLAANVCQYFVYFDHLPNICHISTTMYEPVHVLSRKSVQQHRNVFVWCAQSHRLALG